MFNRIREFASWSGGGSVAVRDGRRLSREGIAAVKGTRDLARTYIAGLRARSQGDARTERPVSWRASAACRDLLSTAEGLPAVGY
eukprot:6698752-Alexandrium_andersonii.AAC.1